MAQKQTETTNVILMPLRATGTATAPITVSSNATSGMDQRSYLMETVMEIASIIDAKSGGTKSTPRQRERVSTKMATEREVTDAKLEAVEARVETRLVGIEGKLDRLLDRVEASVEASKEAKAEASLAKTAAGNTKWNILFTGLTVLALLLAMWAIWNQGMELVAGMFSATPPASPPPQ